MDLKKDDLFRSRLLVGGWYHLSLLSSWQLKGTRTRRVFHTAGGRAIWLSRPLSFRLSLPDL